MTQRPQDTSAEEPDGGNPHIRFRGGPELGNRLGLLNKVLCISKWAKAPSPEERDAILPKEVPATLKLYLDGVIEQMWFKLDAPGVVFLVNAESVDAAKIHVHGLPMGQAGLMDFDFIPVGPLAPLGMLIAEK